MASPGFRSPSRSQSTCARGGAADAGVARCLGWHRWPRNWTPPLQSVSAALRQLEAERLIVSRGHGRHRTSASASTPRRVLRVGILTHDLPLNSEVDDGGVAQIRHSLGDAGHMVFFSKESQAQENASKRISQTLLDRVRAPAVGSGNDSPRGPFAGALCPTRPLRSRWRTTCRRPATGGAPEGGLPP